MRLQLTLAWWSSVAALLWSAQARAEVVELNGRGGLYWDTDETTIWTATTAIRGTIEELVTLEARYLADIISTASIDVVSAATESFEEIRHEAEGGVSYADGTRSASATYIFSYEPDWLSHTAALGLGHDVFDHQLTIGLGGNFVHNEIGRKDDDNFDERLLGGGGTLSMALVATSDDLISLAYTVTYSGGYHASPYRFAYLRDPSGTDILLGPPETHPDRRVRHALAMRYNRYLFKNSALRSHIRGYVDDWGIESLTIGTEYVIGFPPVELGVRIRGYIQSKATFYEAIYAEPRRYMTADREMGAFMDGFAGGKVGVRHRFGGALETLRAELRVDGFGFQFFDFARLASRAGVIGELGIGADF